MAHHAISMFGREMQISLMVIVLEAIGDKKINYRSAFSPRMKDTRRKIQKQQQKLPCFISRIIELSFNLELRAGKQMLPQSV